MFSQLVASKIQGFDHDDDDDDYDYDYDYAVYSVYF